MEFEDLYNLVVTELVPVIEINRGIEQYIKKVRSFEGWLKAELINVLCKYGYDAMPEEGSRVDVSVENRLAIELKISLTNYETEGIIRSGSKGITKSVDGIVSDILKLEEQPFKYLYIIFIVVPLENHNRKEWQKYHIPIIQGQLLYDLKYHPFKIGKYAAIIYIGKVTRMIG